MLNGIFFLKKKKITQNDLVFGNEWEEEKWRTLEQTL